MLDRGIHHLDQGFQDSHGEVVVIQSGREAIREIGNKLEVAFGAITTGQAILEMAAHLRWPHAYGCSP